MHLPEVPRLVFVSPTLQLKYFLTEIFTAELKLLTEIFQEYQHIKDLHLNSVELPLFSSLFHMKRFL